LADEDPLPLAQEHEKKLFLPLKRIKEQISNKNS
jgi:hypothetical protein